MKEPEFTPGDWHSCGTHVWAAAAKDRGNIAECDEFEGSFGGRDDRKRAREIEANARLIAAAPNLYRAMGELLDLEDVPADARGRQQRELQVRKNCRDALAKALLGEPR